MPFINIKNNSKPIPVSGQQLPPPYFENKQNDLFSGVKEVVGKSVTPMAPLVDVSEGLNSKLGGLKNIESPKNDLVADDLKGRSYTIDELFQQAIEANASDLHITAGYRATIRVDGVLRPINSEVISSNTAVMYAAQLLKSRPDLKNNDSSEIDLAYSTHGRRFRLNIFKQMGNISISARVIPDKILTVEELGLPLIIKEFSKFANGIVLITGPTGSGKTTTLASILNLINATYPKHIITLEDPVEFVYPKGLGVIEQREYGVDFKTWGNALRSVLRQDPDVVLVGEMRDLETVEAALQIAETGHLVFATLHTNGAAPSIDRIIDIFPPTKQEQIRIQLAGVLRAIMAQRLVQINTGGRRAAAEILIGNSAVKSSIREGKTPQIDNIIQTSADAGMISLEKSLTLLIKQGLVSIEKAKSIANKPDEIDVLMKKL